MSKPDMRLIKEEKTVKYYEEVFDEPEEKDIRVEVSVDGLSILDATGATLLATIKKIGEQAFASAKDKDGGFKEMRVKFSVIETIAPEEE